MTYEELYDKLASDYEMAIEQGSYEDYDGDRVLYVTPEECSILLSRNVNLRYVHMPIGTSLMMMMFPRGMALIKVG